MTVHAFGDESRRGSLYIVAEAIAKPADLRRLRREMRCLLLPGQREVHFNDQKDPRRRLVSDAIARLPIEVRIYHRTCTRYFEPSRQECIKRITKDLLDVGAHRLVLDSRAHLDAKDEATIRAVISRHIHRTRLIYEHVDSTSESLLWVADAAASCFGAGGGWRKRIDPIVAAVIDLDCS